MQRRLGFSVVLVGLLAIAGVPGAPFSLLAEPAEASATSLSGVKIALDPGHGGTDPGAVGNGLQEKAVNLDVALRARDLLQQEGASVYMTRTTDATVSLTARTDGANAWGAHRLISIHSNSCGGCGGHGTETYYHDSLPSTSTSARLANDVQQEAIEHWGLTNRGVKQANFHMLRESNMPAALLEMGFIDHSGDAAKLGSATWRQEMARAILHAVHRHYSITPHDPSAPPPPPPPPPGFSVSIQAPANNQWIGGTTTARGTSNQEGSLNWMRFLVDGAVAKWVTPSPHEWAWDTRGWGDGSHTLTLEAENTGAARASASITSRIDNTPPSTSSSVSGTAGTNGWWRSAVTVSLGASDAGSGVAATYHRVDGGGWATGTSRTVSGDGIHTVDYYSRDAVGNTEGVKSRQVRIDTTPPTVALLRPAQGRSYVLDNEIPLPAALPKTVVVHDLTVGSASSDATSGVARVEFRVDGALKSSGPGAFVWHAGDHALGDHTLEARAVDQAGNVSGPASRVVTTVPTSQAGLADTLT